MSTDITTAHWSIDLDLLPGPIKQHERMLLQRQLVTVTGRGRKLTDLGVTRAIEKARRLSQSA